LEKLLPTVIGIIYFYSLPFFDVEQIARTAVSSQPYVARNPLWH